MIEFLPPQPVYHDISLLPERSDRKKLSTAADPGPATWQGRLSIAEPIVFPVTAEKATVDPDLAAYLASQRNAYDYHLLLIHCSFSPPADEPIDRAWVSLQLPQAGALKSVAMRLSPASVVDQREIEREISGKVEVGLTGTEFTLGVEGSKSTKAAAADLFITATGEGENLAFWEFMQTPLGKIHGSFRLKSIIRSPISLSGHGSIAIKAAVRRKRFGLIAYRAELPAEAGARFDLA